MRIRLPTLALKPRRHHQKSKTGVSVAPKMDVFRQFFFKNAVPTWCPCSPVVALCWCTGRTPEEVSPPRCSPDPSCKTSVPALQHNNNSNKLWEFCCNSNSLNTMVEDWTERQGRPKVYYVDRPLQLEGSNPWKQQPPEVGSSSGPVERKFRWPRSDLCGPDWIQFQKKIVIYFLCFKQ